MTGGQSCFQDEIRSGWILAATHRLGFDVPAIHTQLFSKLDN